MKRNPLIDPGGANMAAAFNRWRPNRVPQWLTRRIKDVIKASRHKVAGQWHPVPGSVYERVDPAVLNRMATARKIFLLGFLQWIYRRDFFEADHFGTVGESLVIESYASEPDAFQKFADDHGLHLTLSAGRWLPGQTTCFTFSALPPVPPSRGRR